MHFLFSLLRIKGLYVFRELLAHPQEALRTAIGVLRECYVSWLHQSQTSPEAAHLKTRTQYTKCRLCSAPW
jgi:hypothetical protein